MKKLFLILVLSLLLSTVSSCKYNVSNNKYVTKEEAEEFIKDKIIPFYEEQTSFVYTEKYETSSFNDNTKYANEIEYEIYGSLTDNLIGEIHYEINEKNKIKSILLTGKEVQKTSRKEIADIFLRKDSDDDKYYFTIDSDINIHDGKIKQQILRTTLKSDSQFYDNVIKKLENMVRVLRISYIDKYSQFSDYDVIVPSGNYYYISNEKLKVVSSTTNTHNEEVFVFKDDVLVSYKSISKVIRNGSETTYEREFNIKDTKEVKVPNKAENYKTEYQKYNHGLFDNINLGLIVVIFVILLILSFVIFVVIRFLKRPKFNE